MKFRNIIMEATVQDALQPPTSNGSYYRLRVYDSVRRQQSDSYTYINGVVLVHKDEENVIAQLETLAPKDRVLVNGSLIDVSSYISRDGTPRSRLTILASGSNSVKLVRRAEVQAEEAAAEVASVAEEPSYEDDPFADMYE